MEELSAKHPCFNVKAKAKYARVHLPVAPKCNIQCGYCNRSYDCVNESRPGVTSSVLDPDQAVVYADKICEKYDNISVFGIAGPGDAFAQPEQTLATIRGIQEKYPDKAFCISTNGLEIEPWIDELKKLNVKHITLTINGVKHETYQKIYPWVRYKKRVLRGEEAAKTLMDNQYRALKRLKDEGFVVKVNSVIIPGVNETELVEVAQKVAALGADVMNCIPLIPAKGSQFEDYKKPVASDIARVKRDIAQYIEPMTHCARCRADAAGLVGHDEDVYKLMDDCKVLPTEKMADKPYVAVATNEGLLVNQHLGEANEFHVFRFMDNQYELVEVRKAPQRGHGDLRWINLGKVLNDCSTILVNGVGGKPVNVLQQLGIGVIEMTGLINDGLDAVYKGAKLHAVKKSTKSSEGCVGGGGGCG